MIVLLIAGGLAAVAYGVSIYWPVYDWSLQAPSPDGRYELVVLRGDKAAFDDFFYRIYVFPNAVAPQERARGERVRMFGRWRGSEYLIYSGYGYPMFRWTGPRALEIDLTDLYPQVSEFHPVKNVGGREAILASLVFGRDNPANLRP
jgi:hypothetical protein